MTKEQLKYYKDIDYKIRTFTNEITELKEASIEISNYPSTMVNVDVTEITGCSLAINKGDLLRVIDKEIAIKTVEVATLEAEFENN